jgi:hypothetical protein
MANLSKLSKTALGSKTYQELAKAVGREFIGKKHHELVQIIFERNNPTLSIVKVGNTKVGIVRKSKKLSKV